MLRTADTKADRTRRPPAGRLMLVAALVIGLAGCGGDDDPEPGQSTTATTDTTTTRAGQGPRVADRRFDGVFLIAEAIVEGQVVPLEAVASLDFETEFGALVVEPGCNRYFGSFTLAEDGGASFTVAGGSQNSCDGLERQDQQVLEALRGVSGWTEVEGGFRFDGSNASSLTINR